MSYYFNFQKNTFHILTIITRTHITIFQLSQDLMSYFSNFHTTTSHIIPIFTRQRVLLFDFSNDNMSHISKYDTNMSHFLNFQANAFKTIPNIRNHMPFFLIFRRPGVTLFQLSQEHKSHYSNCQRSTYIIPIFIRKMPHYSNFQTATCHIRAIVTRPHVTLFHFSNFTFHIIPILKKISPYLKYHTKTCKFITI